MLKIYNSHEFQDEVESEYLSLVFLYKKACYFVRNSKSNSRDRHVIFVLANACRSINKSLIGIGLCGR